MDEAIDVASSIGRNLAHLRTKQGLSDILYLTFSVSHIMRYAACQAISSTGTIVAMGVVGEERRDACLATHPMPGTNRRRPDRIGSAHKHACEDWIEASSTAAGRCRTDQAFVIFGCPVSVVSGTFP